MGKKVSIAQYTSLKTIREVVEFINKNNILKEDIINSFKDGEYYYLLYYSQV